MNEEQHQKGSPIERIYSMSTRPWAFVLLRDEDVSGVSGTGVVAEGVEFSDGTVSLRWTSAWPTSVVFHDRGIESVRAIHGHDGRTRLMWPCIACARFNAEKDAFCVSCAVLTAPIEHQEGKR